MPHDLALPHCRMRVTGGNEVPTDKKAGTSDPVTTT